MNAKKVKPQKWIEDDKYPIKVLYDDGEYSVIWGKYENTIALGSRWNGRNNAGYPKQGKYPTWYVEPDFIAISILQRLLTLSVDKNDTTYLDNLLFAINEMALKE